MISNWTVWIPERGGTFANGRTVGGHDAHDAAENMAEHLCRVDPDNYKTFLEEEGLVIHVRGGKAGEVTVLRVCGRQSITFRATEEGVPS